MEEYIKGTFAVIVLLAATLTVIPMLFLLIDVVIRGRQSALHALLDDII